MPMYEFECQKCGHKTEKLMKIEDNTKKIACSKCDGIAVKAVSRASAHFKGGGWTPKHYR